MSPLRLFRLVAITEAVTWLGLLVSMYVKYLTDAEHTGEQMVGVTGLAHGIAFMAYCATTLAVAVAGRWPLGRVVLALVSAIPPFMTAWFDRYAESRGHLPHAWRRATAAR